MFEGQIPRERSLQVSLNTCLAQHSPRLNFEMTEAAWCMAGHDNYSPAPEDHLYL